MNKNILLLLTFLVSMNASAQLTLNFGKNVYYKAEVELEDGTIKSGYVLDFQNKPVISNQMVNMLSAFNTKERNLGLANRFYHFRKDKNAKDEKIPISDIRSEEHTSELQSRENLVCRLLLEKKKKKKKK